MGNVMWYFQIKISDTSSEEQPIANSTFHKDAESSDSEFEGSVPVKVFFQPNSYS